MFGSADMILPDSFFARDAQVLARELLGKVIRHRQGEPSLSARISETEACYAVENGRHASLGYIEQPQAIIQECLLGIPHGRDEHLAYRFVDALYTHGFNRNPLRRRQQPGRDY